MEFLYTPDFLWQIIHHIQSHYRFYISTLLYVCVWVVFFPLVVIYSILDYYLGYHAEWCAILDFLGLIKYDVWTVLLYGPMPSSFSPEIWLVILSVFVMSGMCGFVIFLTPMLIHHGYGEALRKFYGFFGINWNIKQKR
ncbi:MAG: hypothetical protein O0X93_08710 [Methanocorpusculum sp.]|nr:hypothetical protein [Methanocorpusculum sp.]MDE2523219.1 hypothetical protein [Methanocorpusculum sp.]MDE2523953.1 hypothetical protein [Methanocorpusculum sp.]